MTGRGVLVRLPARPGPLVGYFASRALVGAALGLPLSVSVAALVGARPAGDAELWRPGGVLLLETLRLLEPSMPGLGWSAAVVGLVAAFALLVPLAVLIASMGVAPSPSPVAGTGRLLRIAADRFGTLGLLMGIVLLLQSVALLLWVVFVSVALTALDLEPSTHLVTKLLVVPLGALVPWLLGLVQDVARVAVVQYRCGVLDALAVALGSLRGQLRNAVIACAWRGSVAIAVLGSAAWLTLAIGCRSSRQLVGAIAVQLAALLVVAVVRASWFRWITRRLPLIPA